MADINRADMRTRETEYDVDDFIRGIEGSDESSLVRIAAGFDGKISVAEIDSYLAHCPYSFPWTTEDTVANVRQSFANGTPLADFITADDKERKHWQGIEAARMARIHRMAREESPDADPPPQEPRMEESCPDMTGAEYGSCAKHNGRVVSSFVSRRHRPVRRETVVIIVEGNRPLTRTTPAWASALVNTCEARPAWADAIAPCTRSAYVYVDRNR